MLPYGKITILDGKTIISRPEITGNGYDEKLKKALAAMYAATGVNLEMYFANGQYSNSAIGDFIDNVMDIVAVEYPRGKSVEGVFMYAERAAYKYVKDKWRF